MPPMRLISMRVRWTQKAFADVLRFRNHIFDLFACACRRFQKLAAEHRGQTADLLAHPVHSFLGIAGSGGRRLASRHRFASRRRLACRRASAFRCWRALRFSRGLSCLSLALPRLRLLGGLARGGLFAAFASRATCCCWLALLLVGFRSHGSSLLLWLSFAGLPGLHRAPRL